MSFLATDKRVRRCNAAALALLMLGSIQMAGYVLHSPALRGIGAATGAAPLPKVFSAVKGYETFATQFDLAYELDGRTQRVAITPEFYAHLRGPYNRRNVYGAALSYGPRLPRQVWLAVLTYGLKAGGPFRAEMGVPPAAQRPRVEIRSLTRGSSETWTLDPTCVE